MSPTRRDLLKASAGAVALALAPKAEGPGASAARTLAKPTVMAMKLSLMCEDLIEERLICTSAMLYSDTETDTVTAEVSSLGEPEVVIRRSFVGARFDEFFTAIHSMTDEAVAAYDAQPEVVARRASREHKEAAARESTRARRYREAHPPSQAELDASAHRDAERARIRALAK